MYCPKCGTPLPDNARFCRKCRHALVPGTPPPPVRTPAAPMPAPKPKKPKGLIAAVIIAAVILLALITVTVIVLLKKGKEEPALTNFAADELYLVSDESTTITFTVQCSSDADRIKLYCDGDGVGTMRDNGKDGDAEADDGIYTCQIEERRQTDDDVSSCEYHCEYDDLESESLTVYCFPTLTEESARQAQEAYKDLSGEITSTQSSYLDSDGFVSEDDREEVLDEVEDIIKDAVDDGTVLHYERGENGISIKMRSGLSMIYALPLEGVDAIGSDVSMSILSLQPCYTDMDAEMEDYLNGGGELGFDLPQNVDRLMLMQDAAAQDVEDILPNYTFSNSDNYNDSAVTLEVIRSFGSDQVILWHGHGYYDSSVKPCLLTGDTFDWDAWWWDVGYFADCVSGRILTGSDDSVLISYKYIKKHCGDMENSFVYLAACLSGASPELANAFADKGAAVVANTDTIKRTYNVAMLYGTVTQMLRVDPETGSFYTLQDALDRAKDIYGDSDSGSPYNGIGATPVVFGGEDAQNYRFAEEVPTGTISGKVCEASDRSTPIAGATIEILFDGASYTTLTTDSEGHYEAEIPFGSCEVMIVADGYISFTCYNEIRPGSTTYMETFLMVQGDEDQSGTASGKVVNSLSGQGADNVALSFTKNWNNTDPSAEILETASTDSEGNYSVELPCGNYTVIAEKEGYSRSSFNIVIQPGDTPNQDGTITPVTSGNDYLITLTWGEDPNDVDSHVRTEEFHVYYNNKSYYEDGVCVCNLDYDDTTSYGPEHITLTAVSSEPYYYYLHRYAGRGSLSSSGAKVTIEQGNRLLAEFHVPTNLGTGDYWNVFAIKDGDIIVRNTITSSQDTTYAND